MAKYLKCLIVIVFVFCKKAEASDIVDMSKIDFIKRSQYTSFISLIKTAPAVGVNFSFFFNDKLRIGFDTAYASGTNKGRNFAISTHIIELAYEFVKQNKLSWYTTLGAGTAFLELQNESINVSRETVFANSIGTGISYLIMEKYSFGFKPEKRLIIDPVIGNIAVNVDIRSVATTSNLPFAGGTTFGRLALGFVIGF